MNQFLSGTLGLQVKAVGFSGVRVQGAHVQQSFHVAVQCRLNDLAWQFDVGPFEAGTVPVRVIEDTDQVDNGIDAFKLRAQLSGIMYIGSMQGDVWMNCQFAVPLRVTRQNANAVAIRGKPIRQVLSDEATATKDTDSFHVHSGFTLAQRPSFS